MKISKLLNKKNLSIIIFSLLLTFNTVADEKLIISKTDFENNDYLKLSHGKKKHVIIKIS